MQKWMPPPKLRWPFGGRDTSSRSDAALPHLDEARKIYAHFTGDSEAPAGALRDSDL